MGNEEKKDVDVKQVGAGLMLIDPNPSGRDVLPAEDMFIYISLTAEERSRGVVTAGENENEFEESRFGEIEFVSTEVKYNQAGEPMKDIMGDVKSYATTSYTNIGGIQNSYGSGTLEGFGISSINIKYNTSLVPQVDIDFIDIRGSGLFDVIEQDNRKSPYSIFFKMPYPIFTLTVKGYFGKPVEYCLNLVTWTSKFDPTSGNFLISANFVGFQQAFLADLTIGDIIGVVNTKQGLNNLNKLPLTVGSETILTQTPRLDLFVKDLSKLQIDLEALKIDSDSYKKLRVLNTQVKKLENIRGFIGSPLGKENSDTSTENTPYLKQLNDPDQIESSSITSASLKKLKEYVSIRDLLFFKQTNIQSVNNFMDDLFDKIQDYVKFYSDNKNQINNSNDYIAAKSFLYSGYQFNQEYWRFIENLDGQGSINYDAFKLIINDTNSSNDGYTLTLLQFIDLLRTEDSILLSNTPEQYKSCNQNFDVSKILRKNFSNTDSTTEKGNKNSDFNDSTVGFVMDFRGIRMLVNDMIISIKEEKKKIEEKVVEELNVELSKQLGYKPTIGTIFQILCNNAQAFLQTIYEVGRSAEQKNRDRQKALSKATVTTDLQLKEEFDFKSQTIYAFPSLYVKENGGFVEKYIGSEGVFPEGDEDSLKAFPEITFIDDMIKALISKENTLKSATSQVLRAKQSGGGSDTDNWIPINPTDYEVNPFYLLNSAQSNTAEGKEVLYKKFLTVLVERFLILKYYSFPDDTQRGVLYGQWDGLLAKLSFIDDTIKKVLQTFVKNENGVNNEKIDKLLEEIINEIEFKSVTDDEEDFLILGNTNKGTGILGNSVKLVDEQKNSAYTSLYVEKPISQSSTKDNYLEYNGSNLNLQHNLSYKAWPNTIDKKLINKVSNPSMVFSINDSNITIFDGGTNPINNTGVNTPEETKYINLYSTEASRTSNLQIEPLLTDSDFYNDNDTKSKALLLLSTLPLANWASVYKFMKKETTIVYLPKYFLLFIGGTLWRTKKISPTDPINWVNYSGTPQQPPQENYISSPVSPDDELALRGPIEDSLLKLPKKTKQNLVDYFIQWAQGNEFKNFEKKVKEYTDPDLDVEKKYEKGQVLCSSTLLGAVEKLIIVAPKVFDANPNQDITLAGFKEFYYEGFRDNFIGNTKPTKPKNSNKTIDEQTKDMENIKQSAYNSLKNVYDRWVAGSLPNKLAFNACGSAGVPLFDYFKFVDRGFNEIGDRAIINLDSVLTLSENMTTNLYFFISKLLRDSNFLLQILPNYINYKDPEEVSTMFKPISNISERNDSSGPTYLCIYAGGASQVLNIEEQNRYTFKNDGFNLDFPPSDISSKNNDTDFNLVGFRVSFGTENQTVFKSVSLNQQEHKDTSEYHKTLTDLIDKRGGTSRTYQGTDLYKMFRARSYTCNVEALGCMNIQPMMYFQLDNVPFFDGAYMILNVTHNISPNHMTTSFTGVRQSKYLTPVVDKLTTFLNIGLDDTLDTEPVFERSLVIDTVDYNTGIPLDKGPEDQFNFGSLTVSSLINVGVEPKFATTELVTNLKSSLIDSSITSNSQVTMFLANALTKSNNFSNPVDIWNNPTDKSGKVIYCNYGNKFGNGSYVEDPITDAYTFRPRGYIPIIGRDQYERFSKSESIPMTKLTGDTLDIETACKISVWRWNNYPYSESHHNEKKMNQQLMFQTVAEDELENLLTKTPAEIQILQSTIPGSINPIEEKQLLIKAYNTRILELGRQEDESLKSEENYPPGGYANGGQSSNFSTTVELLNFKGGKDIPNSFENFSKVLNEYPTKNGESNLLGTNVSKGTKFNKKGNIKIYTSKQNQAVNNSILSPGIASGA